MTDKEKHHLPRLAPEVYRGEVYVHWTFTMEQRKTGWLIPVFLYKFRELLTHTAFRYRVTCPIFCLMPDHMHLVLVGIDPRSDQLKATKFLRKHLNLSLGKLNCRLQHQPHDRMLRDDERLEDSFTDLVEYIARNPERAGLVAQDGFKTYKYSGCLVPGYPELSNWQDDFWPRFWRALSFSRNNGLFRPSDEKLNL